MHQIYSVAVIFHFWLWKNFETSKKTKRLEKDEIKKQLLDSIGTNNTVEIEELNDRAEKVEKPEDTAEIIREYEEIIHAKRKGIIMVAYYKRKIFKRFKEKEKFQEMVEKLQIHKSTIIFKINVFKLIEKYLKLMRSSGTLTFLKNYLKDIKKVCEDNLSYFK